jgi:acetolactate synthase regulatory subunit
MSAIHRIYTEAKNKRNILKVANQRFESFTVQATSGFYKGRKEKSIVIEIVGASARSIEQLADKIRRMNGQSSVLILTTRGNAKITRR